MYDPRSVVEVVCPTVTTQDTLTANLATLGYPATTIKAMRPRIIAKTTSANVPKAQDDTVTLSGTNLVIAEGATGFATGDRWLIALNVGGESVTAVASTA